MIIVKTAVIRDGFVQMVPNWSATEGQAVYLYAEEFGSPYCPIQFEVRNEHC